MDRRNGGGIRLTEERVLDYRDHLYVVFDERVFFLYVVFDVLLTNGNGFYFYHLVFKSLICLINLGSRELIQWGKLHLETSI